MSAATSTILTIAGLGTLAGTQVIGAGMQAGAQKDAAKTQAAAADNALGVQERQYQQSRADQERLYQQQRADEAPYLGLGAGSVGALQYGLGLNAADTQHPAPTADGHEAPGAPVPTKTPAQQWWAAQLPGHPAGRPQGALGMLAGGPQPSSGPANGIPMRSPNGQVKRVAPDQVAHYQGLGAEVV